jgi:SAM-dependent methyltransferase
MKINLNRYMDELEHVSCNACGADDGDTFCKKERFGLPLNSVICKQCGLMYINPRPVKRMYQEFNKSDYRKAVSGTDEGITRIFRQEVVTTQRSIIPFFKKHAGFDDPQMLLDVGCSYGGIAGAFLERYRDLEACGVEPVEKNAEYATKRTRMNVTTGLFEDYVTENKFDIAIFAQAINHTLDPLANLKKIRSLLTDRGVLYLSIQDTVSALLNRPLERMVEVNHPYMFCRESIQYLVKKAGFEIIGYEDLLLDGDSLTRQDIPRLRFPRIRILARKTEEKDDIERPDYKEIKRRITSNVNFREQWHETIDKWHKTYTVKKIAEEDGSKINAVINYLTYLSRRVYKRIFFK